ncbi:MAG: AAA family ATPase [Spirochaetota bacterium]
MIRERIHNLLEAMEVGVYERETATRLAFLATIAGESVFLLGPPGVAKSLIARRVKFAFHGAKSFEYLMGRFSTPDEIFGPISIQRLKEHDRYERITDNYLPQADIVFLDEIWKAGPPIQNALLTALNEKRFRNGAQEIQIPMKGLISASNDVPELDAGQRAFWDRFLVRLPLRAIERDENFHNMLADSGDEYQDTVPDELKVTQQEYEHWRQQIDNIDLPRAILSLLSAVRSRLSTPDANEEHEAIYLSDRRWKKIARLLKASAFLNGREAVNVLDCGLLRHCIWDRPEDMDYVFSVLADELAGFDFGEEVEPRFAARELGALKRRVREATIELVEEDTFEPVLYRGEYVRLKGLDDTRLSLIWHGDYEALETDRGTECEVFLFNSDMSFSETITFEEVRRCEEPAVCIDGEEYPVEHYESRGTSARVREPEQSEREAWISEAQTVAERCGDAVTHALEIRQTGSQEAHLFVEPEFAQHAFAALEAAAEEFEQLRLTAERLKGRLGGSH